MPTSNQTNFGERFSEMIEQRAERRAVEMIEQMIAEMAIDGDVARVNAERRTSQHEAPVIASLRSKLAAVKQRRASGPQKEYVLTGKTRGSDALIPTAAKAFAWISKRNKPVTLRDVIAGTGLKPKTVESVIWLLKTNGFIRSRVIGGK